MEDPASASRRNEQRGLDEKSPDDPVYPVKSGSRGRSPSSGFSIHDLAPFFRIRWGVYAVDQEGFEQVDWIGVL